MPSESIIESGKRVVKIELNAVNNLYNSINDEFVKAVNIISESKGRVVFTGMGKSGLIARKIVATMNSTGTPAIYMHPTDALHGDLGMVRKEDIVVMISKSGSTEELINLAPMIKRIGTQVIGIFSSLECTLTRFCDLILYVKIEEEACPHDLAPTASTTATLVLGDALAIALLEKKHFSADDFAMLHPAGSLGKRLSLRISEIMINGEAVPKVKMNTPIKDAIYEITSKRLGVTTVIDDTGKLKGIITDGDLRRLLERTLEIGHLEAKDIMTKNPKRITPDLLASFALQQMEKFKITSLVAVNDKDEPAGIVHLHDLVKLGLQTR